MSLIAPEIPDDGHMFCESCNYLEPVAELYVMDDGSAIVPLCQECSDRLKNPTDTD